MKKSLLLCLSLATTPLMAEVQLSPDSAPQDLTDHVPQAYDVCTRNLLINGDENLTLAEIRAQCAEAKAPDMPLSKRYLSETLTEKNPFVITPHHVNYAIFGFYPSSINEAPFEEAAGHPLKYEDAELQFQLSFKAPLFKNVNILNESVDFYAAYTNRSFWQIFDDKDSIPFRETNHEPEAWAEIHADLDFFSFNLHKVMLGVNHQSNGQSGNLSRGWNRAFVQAQLQHEDGYLSFKTWQRFDEQDKFDNSFDYEVYLGDYELEGVYKMGENSFGMTLRNRYDFNQYGSLLLDYTYPMTKRLKGYVQLFTGYGDSLIDMDHYNNKIGIGIVLADRI